jgi:hypothetical protein
MKRKKENLFESRQVRTSLFSFSVMKKIFCHFNPALIFSFFCIKTKGQKTKYVKIFIICTFPLLKIRGENYFFTSSNAFKRMASNSSPGSQHGI